MFHRTSMSGAADQSRAFRMEKVEEFFLSSACATLLPPHGVLTKHAAKTFAKGQKHQRSGHSSGRFRCNISFINTICKCPLCRGARRLPTSQSLNKFLFCFKLAQTLSNVSGVIQGEALCSLSASLQRRTNVSRHREPLFQDSGWKCGCFLGLTPACWYGNGDGTASESQTFTL